MLDNYDVLQYEKPIADAYAEVTRLLMENIAKHLSSDGDMYAAMWETKKLKEMGMLTRENARIINKYLKDVPKDVTNGMKGAAQDAYDQLKSMASVAERMEQDPREPDEIVRDTIDYWRSQALDKMNLTNTTMLESGQQAYLRAINDVMRLTVDAMSDSQKQNTMNTLNTSAYGVISGGLTFDKAKEYAINQMMDDGVYGFVDRAGRHWSPEAYASMVVRTTVHNVSVEATKQMSIDFGVDVFQCSWHPGSRPSHYDYQGQFYSWSGEAGTFVDGNGEEHAYVSVDEADYGDAAGLFGVNCNHQPLPMDEGVSVPFSPDEIPSREENDAAYAESQEQRALERSIRDAKTKIDVYKAAGNEKKAQEWNAKIRERQAKMRQFINETGRKRDYEREKVYNDPNRKLTEAEQRAINDYKGSRSYPINDVLRRSNGDLSQLSDTDRRFVETLDSGLSKIGHYFGTVVRDLDFSLQGKEVRDKFIGMHRVGETVRYHQYLSTTTNGSYSDTPDVRIYISDTTKGHDLRNRGLTEESEVLFERTQEFVVLNMVENNGVMYILMKEA